MVGSNEIKLEVVSDVEATGALSPGMLTLQMKGPRVKPCRKSMVSS